MAGIESAGADGKGGTIVGDGGIGLTGLEENQTEGIMGFEKVGLQLQGFAIGGDGLFELPRLAVSISEVAIALGDFGIEGD